MIKLPRAVFSQKLRSGRGVLSEAEVLLTAARAQPTGEGFLHHVYRIHAARHAAVSGTHDVLSLKHGQHLVVAVYTDKVIGFNRRDYLWVHPDHRGNGLGPEMSAQLLIEMGCKEWDLAEWQWRLARPSHTASGLQNLAKVYDVLVRRGIIADEDNT